jgi:hypothetical protein
MGVKKEQKTKEERLKEGITLLKQLRENGVSDTSNSFIVLKGVVSEWVTSGNPVTDVVPFPEYGRVAEIDLPKYNNRSAGINFKVKRAF